MIRFFLGASPLPSLFSLSAAGLSGADFAGAAFSPPAAGAVFSFTEGSSLRGFSSAIDCFSSPTAFAALSPEEENSFLTSAIASSSIELCATFTSYPLACRKSISSLLFLSNSFASSCTFIFAILTTSNYSESPKCFRIEFANPSSVSARTDLSSLPIECPSAAFVP